MVILLFSFNLLFDFYPLHQQFWGVYKLQNLILTNFLDIIWNIFDFYDLSHIFLVVPRGHGVVVKIAKSHFDKFCHHFKYFGTLYELSQIIWGALKGGGGRVPTTKISL